MARLEPGVTAPAFGLPGDDGRVHSLADMAGRRFVLYFYPADDTPGCTKEACQFNDLLGAFRRAKVAVMGVSPDSADRHRAFRAKYGLKFPLLTDESREVMAAYGAYGAKQLYGRSVIGAIRSTFVIGPTGLVEHAFYGVRTEGHAARVLAQLAGEPPKA
jgi:peroxiredoxin Q/BCP